MEAPKFIRDIVEKLQQESFIWFTMGAVDPETEEPYLLQFNHDRKCIRVISYPQLRVGYEKEYEFDVLPKNRMFHAYVKIHCQDEYGKDRFGMFYGVFDPGFPVEDIAGSGSEKLAAYCIDNFPQSIEWEEDFDVNALGDYTAHIRKVRDLSYGYWHRDIPPIYLSTEVIRRLMK